MKGITPIVSVILLIAMAASAAAMIAAWQGSFLSDYIGDIDRESKLRLLCNSASILAEAASFDCNNDCSEGVIHTFTADVKNTGEASLELNKVFLVLKDGNLLEMPLQQTIAPGQSRTVAIETEKSCTGVAQNVVEAAIPTQCSAVAARISGDEIEWVNCG
ncbi:MAG: hypothetical protein HYW25_02830 [Candidatus Aenigmarchaeota archaeon]|nr:hypothetical protein [Candidatus Aenigmarchaeota archaeon]